MGVFVSIKLRGDWKLCGFEYGAGWFCCITGFIIKIYITNG
jgi:hypothetical protein